MAGGIQIQVGFDLFGPSALDRRIGPYEDTTQALSSINELYRHQGLTVVLTGSGESVEYWFKDGIADVKTAQPKRRDDP